jgi:hypothetical protein
LRHRRLAHFSGWHHPHLLLCFSGDKIQQILHTCNPNLHGRPRQEDGELEASLVSLLRPYLKKKNVKGLRMGSSGTELTPSMCKTLGLIPVLKTKQFFREDDFFFVVTGV